MTELSLLQHGHSIGGCPHCGMIAHRLKCPSLWLSPGGGCRDGAPELEAGLEIIRHTLHRFGLATQEIQYIVNALREEEV